jgi:hypothetical protein
MHQREQCVVIGDHGWKQEETENSHFDHGKIFVRFSAGIVDSYQSVLSTDTVHKLKSCYITDIKSKSRCTTMHAST